MLVRKSTRETYCLAGSLERCKDCLVWSLERCWSGNLLERRIVWPDPSRDVKIVWFVHSRDVGIDLVWSLERCWSSFSLERRILLSSQTTSLESDHTPLEWSGYASRVKTLTWLYKVFNLGKILKSCFWQFKSQRTTYANPSTGSYLRNEGEFSRRGGESLKQEYNW